MKAFAGWRPWVAITLLAFVLRAVVAFGWLGSMPLVGDAESYSDFAKELLASFPGTRAYYWPPGQALVLACAYGVLGQQVWIARLVTVLLGTALVPLVGHIGYEVDNTQRTAQVTAVIAAVYPPAVLLAEQPYAQHLAALSVAILAYAFLRAVRTGNVWLFATSGVALGLGCLTRPSMVSVAPALLIVWCAALVRPRGRALARLIFGGVCVAIFAAVLIVPVLAHNRACGAGLVLSTNNERNLFLGNNPYTPSYKTSHLGQRALAELEPETRAYLESFYARPDARAAMRREAFAYMAAHPATMAYRSLNRATSFWGFDYLASRIVQENRGWQVKRFLPMLAIEAGGYVLVMVLAIAGIFGLRGEGDCGWRRWLGALTLAYQLPYVIAFSGGTYHFPVVPLLLPFAALTLARGATGLLRAVRDRWTAAAIVLFAAIQVQYAYFAIVMKG